MKRYLLFNFYNYYPAGGIGDFVNDFETYEECLFYIERAVEERWSKENYQIYDSVENKKIDLFEGDEDDEQEGFVLEGTWEIVRKKENNREG